MLAKAGVRLSAAFVIHPTGHDRTASFRRARDLGDVEVAVDRLRKRAGDRSRRHVENVWGMSAQGSALLDAEAMLLVHDGDREVPPLDALLDQRMRSDDDVGPFELALQGARQERQAHPELTT